MSVHAQCILNYGTCKLLTMCLKTRFITISMLEFAYLTRYKCRHLANKGRNMALNTSQCVDSSSNALPVRPPALVHYIVIVLIAMFSNLALKLRIKISEYPPYGGVGVHIPIKSTNI